MMVKLYTDGSSRGNPGPGGFGCVLQYVDTKGILHEKEISGGYIMTTNNRMELLGVITGLEALNRPCQVEVISDSKYVTDAFNKNWISCWQKRGWKTSSGTMVKNIDLWERLLKAANLHNLTFTWVKGHVGHPENERCDSLATAAADKDESVLLIDEGYVEE